MPRRLKRTDIKYWNEGFYCWLPEAGVKLQGHNIHTLRQRLRTWMAKAGRNDKPVEELLHECICAALAKDRKGINEHCTPEHEPVHKEDVERRAFDADPRGPHNVRRGNPGADAWAWRRLHLAAADGKLTPEYMKRFLNQMSCGTCKSHSQTFIHRNPPPYAADNNEQFRYTWWWHDWVNGELKKPRLTLEQARQLYRLE